MKNFTLFFFLIPFLSFSQTQIGEDINGEAAYDESGKAISLSGDGSTVVIGANTYVRVYDNQSGVWTQIGNNFNQSGYSMSLSNNGNIVAVSGGGVTNIYENQSGEWIQLGSEIDFSGKISISSDGSIVAIGRTSAVKIYRYQSGEWTQIGSDIESDPELDEIGANLSISSDGNILAIGRHNRVGTNGNGLGNVRVYENQSGVWIQIGSDILGEELDDYSGWSVSLSSDGSIIAIGAPWNHGNGVNSGHVRVYEYLTDTWVQLGDDIDGEDWGDLSGRSVSISADGNIVAIGSVKSNFYEQDAEDGNNAGQIQIFKNISGNWVQIGQDINAEPDGFGEYEFQEIAISLSSNGTKVAWGANRIDFNGIDSGQVRVFDISSFLTVEESTQLSFELFPNPAKNQFTIQLQKGQELEKVNIYNNLGQFIQTTQKTIIKTANLAIGLYYVEVITNQGKATKKLIIE